MNLKLFSKVHKMLSEHKQEQSFSMPLKLPFSFTSGKKIISYQLQKKETPLSRGSMRWPCPNMTGDNIQVFFLRDTAGRLRSSPQFHIFFHVYVYYKKWLSEK